MWRGVTPVRVVGLGVLIAAVWLIVDRYGPDWDQIINHYFDAGIIAILEIVIAVLALDWLAERRAQRAYKRGIIQQMGSTVPGFALEAVRLANLEGWLEDGSLRAAGLLYANLQGARLGRANLQGAELTRANLIGAWLMGSNLKGAGLMAANLQSAVLMGTNLQGANLSGSNLESAALIEANLQGANLSLANLRGAELTRAKFDGATVMPDGSAWNKGVDLTRYTNASHPLYWTAPDEEA
jgi:pentapeptide repeat protein